MNSMIGSTSLHALETEENLRALLPSYDSAAPKPAPQEAVKGTWHEVHEAMVFKPENGEDASAVTIREQISDSGNSKPGTIGIIGFFTSLGPLFQESKAAWRESSVEGKIQIVSKWAQKPVTLLLTVGSILSTQSKGAEGLGSILKLAAVKGAAFAGMAVLAPIVMVAGIIYLSIELIKTIMALVKSISFESKMNISGALKQIETLSADLRTAKAYIEKNKEALIEQLGGNDASKRLIDQIIGEHDDNNKLQGEINLLKAHITYTKLQILHKKYVTRPNELGIDGAKHIRFFQKRIGANAQMAFNKGVEKISTFDVPKLEGLSPNALRDFNTKGTTLLKLVNTQRKKVLKVHIFSITVIALSVASIIVSAALLGPAGIMVGVALTVVGIVLSGIRSVANRAYVNNAGNGFSARLFIPYSMAAKDGESNFQMWKTASKGKKVGLVILNILTFGVPAIFDGISKSKWITKLRNGREDEGAIASSYSANPNAAFKENEFTIEPLESMIISASPLNFAELENEPPRSPAIPSSPHTKDTVEYNTPPPNTSSRKLLTPTNSIPDEQIEEDADEGFFGPMEGFPAS